MLFIRYPITIVNIGSILDSLSPLDNSGMPFLNLNPFRKAKKKQEEKHLDLLKELQLIPTNKSCFDCNRRNPSYVNTTIGSFVCILCSGNLRGLTPPHRVKSISLASFGMDEIHLLRSRGNQYCRQVWLAYFTLTDSSFDYKDDQKFLDHLVAKYEQKLWYAEPGTVINNSNSFKVEDKVAPVVQDLLFNVATTSIPRPSAPTVSTVIKDYSNCTTTNSAVLNPQSNFADFENADFFFPQIPEPMKPTLTPMEAFLEPELMKPISNPTNSNQCPNGIAMNSVNGAKDSATLSFIPPVEQDRYSAIKDLDSLFNVAKSHPVPSGGSSWTPVWNSGTNQQTNNSNQTEMNAVRTADTKEAWNTTLINQNTPSASNPFFDHLPVQHQIAVGMKQPSQPAQSWANSNVQVSNEIPNPGVSVANSNNPFDLNIDFHSVNEASLNSGQSNYSAELNSLMDMMEINAAGTRAETKDGWNTTLINQNTSSSSNPFFDLLPVQHESAADMNQPSQPAQSLANFNAQVSNEIPNPGVSVANSNILSDFNFNFDSVNWASLSSGQSSFSAGSNSLMDTTLGKEDSTSLFM